MKKLVILESPYAGDIILNVAYARACVHHSLSIGEAPIASHLLYTQPGILNDNIPFERQWGIDAGLAWKAVAEYSVVYTDLGITKGMQYGIDAVTAAGGLVTYRTLPASMLREVRTTARKEKQRKKYNKWLSWIYSILQINTK